MTVPWRMSRNPLAGDPAFLVGFVLGFGAVIGGTAGFMIGRRWGR